MSSNVEPLSDEDRRLALKDLLNSAGWALLVAHTAQEWGVAGYGQRMESAIRTLPAGPDRAYELAAVADRITQSKLAIDEVMDWPTHELARLTPKKVDHRPFAALRRTSS